MAATIKGTHHISLKTADFDASFRFYTEGLGLVTAFTRGEGDGRMAFLKLPDGSSLELFANGDGIEPAGGWTHLAFEVDSADEAYAAAIQAGAVSRTEPKDIVIDGSPAAMPVKIAFVIGPDKEVIEFFELK